MKFLKAISLLLGLFLLGSCAHSPAVDGLKDCDLYLKNARVVDPEAKKIFQANVVVRDGLIAQVERLEHPTTHHCSQEIDLTGSWLIPGLTDMHVHSFGNPSPTDGDAADENLGTEAVTRLVLKAGVTALLDLGAAEEVILPLRDRLRKESSPPHADLFAAGPVFVEIPPGKDGDRFRRRARGKGPRLVTGPEDAREQVRELAAARPDVIKIIYDHANRRGAMRKATMQAIVSEARKLGFKVVVHIGSWTDAKNAMEAGATSITHLLDEEVIPMSVAKIYAAKKILSIPTMAVQCDLVRFSKKPEMLDDPLLMAVTGEKLRASYRDHAHYSDSAHFVEGWQAEDCVTNDFKSLRRLDELGVVLGAGSDSGNIGVFVGYSVHREMALLVEAGIDPWKALAAATTIPGKFLGHKYGVEIGDEANLDVIGGDPIARIENTELVKHVIVHGRVAF